MKILINITQHDYGFDVDVDKVEFGETTGRILSGDCITDMEMVDQQKATSMNHALNLAADALATLKE